MICHGKRVQIGDWGILLKTFLIAFDKARSVKIDKMGFKKITLQMPTSGDRKQEESDFLANGELFFLDLLSHRRPHFH